MAAPYCPVYDVAMPAFLVDTVLCDVGGLPAWAWRSFGYVWYRKTVVLLRVDSNVLVAKGIVQSPTDENFNDIMPYSRSQLHSASHTLSKQTSSVLYMLMTTGQTGAQHGCFHLSRPLLIFHEKKLSLLGPWRKWRVRVSLSRVQTRVPRLAWFTDVGEITVIPHTSLALRLSMHQHHHHHHAHQLRRRRLDISPCAIFRLRRSTLFSDFGWVSRRKTTLFTIDMLGVVIIRHARHGMDGPAIARRLSSDTLLSLLSLKTRLAALLRKNGQESLVEQVFFGSDNHGNDKSSPRLQTGPDPEAIPHPLTEEGAHASVPPDHYADQFEDLRHIRRHFGSIKNSELVFFPFAIISPPPNANHILDSRSMCSLLPSVFVESISAVGTNWAHDSGGKVHSHTSAADHIGKINNDASGHRLPNPI
ncbi:uncharacterized protein BT62DRAFT_1011144 [Guyanagaster necrorhizus]|uniref:Uncharacterized protein n=1 Tax=Guyanagaster necrorhizus TaxID=856835 RepID=A0A9P7VJW1_9AGAR|nr:uncharacterized protein BT62DRAFT_1011144 [Guyanagaster necrorhizus MCA 3950]KAG7441837.1 hypothetical protein BT62DRAFT_1011144 [Guyanagaster necrorhizus MCA 3950]